MYLIIQYYNDKNIKRQKEYDFCLEKNLNNPAIKEIHNIIENETIIPEKFKNNKKLINIPIVYNNTGSIPGRLTFKYAFDYVKENIKQSEVICIANLDIFFDYSQDWLNIKTDFFNINNTNKVLCLSRYEFISNNNNTINYTLDKRQLLGSSYDSWIFLNNLNKIDDCNFSVGNAPGCDASIAKRFYNSEYKIFNWMEKYKTFHYDLCRGYLNYILTEKTDYEAKNALTRGRLDCPPLQDWNNILLNNINPKYNIK